MKLNAPATGRETAVLHANHPNVPWLRAMGVKVVLVGDEDTELMALNTSPIAPAMADETVVLQANNPNAPWLKAMGLTVVLVGDDGAELMDVDDTSASAQGPGPMDIDGGAPAAFSPPSGVDERTPFEQFLERPAAWRASQADMRAQPPAGAYNQAPAHSHSVALNLPPELGACILRLIGPHRGDGAMDVDVEPPALFGADSWPPTSTAFASVSPPSSRFSLPPGSSRTSVSAGRPGLVAQWVATMAERLPQPARESLVTAMCAALEGRE